MNKARGQVILGIALVAGIALFGVRIVGAFTGPTTSPGQGGGALQYNAVSGSVGIGVTPLDGSQSKLIVAPTGSQIYGLEVRRASGATIITTAATDVVIATPGENATTTINGNLVVTGTINGALGNITVDAGNVTPNVFNINVASGTGNYAFPANLGVGTSTTTNLPRTLSVYGDAYVSSPLYVGTTTIPGGIGSTKAYFNGPIAARAMFGSPTLPQFTFDDDRDTGIYQAGSNEIGFAGNGTRIASFRWRGGSNVGMLDFPLGGIEEDAAIVVGSAGGSGGGGIYSPGAGILAFVTGGIDNSVERMRLVSSTGVGIHTKTPEYTLDVNGASRLMPTSTIPLSSDGAMYYNASAGKFKCYEGGWRNCVGAGGESAGAPSASDCDTDAERGRLMIDTVNNYLYVCNGATRGWDHVPLTD